MSFTLHPDGFESTGDVRSMVGGLFAMLGIPEARPEVPNRADRRAASAQRRKRKGPKCRTA